jgi:hypothetical protein
MSGRGKGRKQTQIRLEPKYREFYRYVSRENGGTGHMSDGIRIAAEILARHVIGHDLEKGEPAPTIPFLEPKPKPAAPLDFYMSDDDSEYKDHRFPMMVSKQMREFVRWGASELHAPNVCVVCSGLRKVHGQARWL